MSRYAVRAKNLSPESDNKIHDDDVARQFGFTGALVPGVEVFAYAAHPFAELWGEEFLARGEIDAQFRSPVYDGEEVRVLADGAGPFELVGPDDVPRARGSARLAEAGPQVDRSRFPERVVPQPLPTADASALAVGNVLGTIRETAGRDAHDAYLAGISDSLPLFQRFVHPGALLRMVNAVLYRSVALGPWIHTASACRFVAPAPVGADLAGYGVVTDRYERNGRSWVRFDALVTADDEPVALVDHLAIYDLGVPAS